MKRLAVYNQTDFDTAVSLSMLLRPSEFAGHRGIAEASLKEGIRRGAQANMDTFLFGGVLIQFKKCPHEPDTCDVEVSFSVDVRTRKDVAYNATLPVE